MKTGCCLYDAEPLPFLYLLIAFLLFIFFSYNTDFSKHNQTLVFKLLLNKYKYKSCKYKYKYKYCDVTRDSLLELIAWECSLTGHPQCGPELKWKKTKQNTHLF